LAIAVIDAFVLLTLACQQQILANVLLRHNPRAIVVPVGSLAELSSVEPDVLARARLVAFTSDVIVPPAILSALGYGAYNFHPGPPTYPGWLPGSFAIYDGARTFGATAHKMIEQVDAGPIVGVSLFDLAPGTTLDALETLAFSHLARLYYELAEQLVTSCSPLPELPIRWSGRKASRRRCAAACDIPVDISADELRRRVQAFGNLPPDIAPRITVHGYQFRIATR
jgi:methionyl-tRNA formyltransferase